MLLLIMETNVTIKVKNFYSMSKKKGSWEKQDYKNYLLKILFFEKVNKLINSRSNRGCYSQH